MAQEFGTVCLVKRIFRHGTPCEWHVAIAKNRQVFDRKEPHVWLLTVNLWRDMAVCPVFEGQDVFIENVGTQTKYTFYRDNFEILRLVDEGIPF